MVALRPSSRSCCIKPRARLVLLWLCARAESPRGPPGTASTPGALSRFPVSVFVCVQFRQKQLGLCLNIISRFLFYSNPISNPTGSFLVWLHQVTGSNSIWGKAAHLFDPLFPIWQVGRTRQSKPAPPLLPCLISSRISTPGPADQPLVLPLCGWEKFLLLFLFS
jgi:hypothetical protein